MQHANHTVYVYSAATLFRGRRETDGRELARARAAHARRSSSSAQTLSTTTGNIYRPHRCQLPVAEHRNYNIGLTDNDGPSKLQDKVTENAFFVNF